MRISPILQHCLNVLLLLSLAWAGNALANPTTSEQTLTAAFLYNFLKFTEWPPGAITDEVTLCVAEGSQYGAELDAINGRTAQNKKVRVKRVELDENPRECHLLFLPREEKPVRIREWLAKSANLPTLMVSNCEEFLDMGGMIMIIEDGSRLQFEVDLSKVKPTGLKLSAQLLKIAKNVRGK